MNFKLFLFLTFSHLIALCQSTNTELYLKLDNANSDKEKLMCYLDMEKNNFENKYLNISEYYYKTGSSELAFDYLKTAIKKGARLEGDILNYIPKNDLIKIQDEYLKLRTQFYETYDEDLYDKIQYLVNTDQYLAKENFYGGRKAQYPIRAKVFQNNLTQLREYIVSYNKSKLPNRKQVGHLTGAISLMMIHHTSQDSIDNVNYNFFEPILKEEVLLRKTYSPYTYIQFVDNMQLVMEEGALQVYGHFRNFKTNKICPLKYPEKVDSLRAEIGLQPLKEYARKNGFSLPDNYIEQ